MADAAPLSTRNRSATRERLRSAAMQTFAREGIGATSIDRLCEAAGFSRGAFYSNYASKHDLALELLAEGQVAEIDFWRDAITNSAELEAAFALLELRFNELASRNDWGLLNVELQLEAERNPEFGARYRAYIDAMYDQMRDLIGKLCATAGIPVPADVTDYIMAIRCFTMGLMLQSAHGGALPAFTNPGKMMLMLFRGLIAMRGTGDAPHG
jgi:AcrR family transcriptional regulator